MRDMVLVRKVQDLYKSGYSVADISKKLGKNSSNISRWCRKTQEIDSDKVASSEEKRRQQFFNLDEIDLESLDVNMCRILLAVIYWCEGAKYPSSNRVDFVCSDENLVITFLFLFRKSFKLDESKFRVKLQIHTDQNFEEITSYWSDKLKIPESKFTKPTVTEKRGGRYRKMYRGTCSVRYGDYSVLLRIMGIYSRFSKVLVSKLI